jgi:hypothetical protein
LKLAWASAVCCCASENALSHAEVEVLEGGRCEEPWDIVDTEFEAEGERVEASGAVVRGGSWIGAGGETTAGRAVVAGGGAAATGEAGATGAARTAGAATGDAACGGAGSGFGGGSALAPPLGG